MRIKYVIPALLLAVAPLSFGSSQAYAAEVNVQVNGYLPAPPGVYVRMDAGRPYYMERDRRVYMERERPRHRKNKHYYKDEKRHNDDRNGHDKHEGHGR